MGGSSVTAVSLLPSATEIVYTLGLEDQLLGRTFECDYPAAAADKPVVLDTKVPRGLAPAQIDAFVKAADGPAGLFAIRDEIGVLAPDVILTQDLCGVCAVPATDVQGALDKIGCSSRVVRLDPHTLDDVIAAIGDVAAALGHAGAADGLMRELRSRVEAVRAAVAGKPRPRTVVLEWVDPPFGTGHWIPEMIETAGGKALLANFTTPSVQVTWDQVAASDAEVLIVSPCGYFLDEGMAQARTVIARPELAALPAVRTGRVYAVDATSVVTRPGPRVVDGVEALASVLHSGLVADRPELIRAVD